jgi:hypothetical protein
MRTTHRILACLVATAALGAGGCKEEKKLPYVDVNIKLAADLPDGWSVSQRNCMLNDSPHPLDGVLGYTVGIRDSGTTSVGMTGEKVKICAIPNKHVAVYDQKRWDRDMVKSQVTAGDHVIFTGAKDPQDPGAQRVLASLKHQP